ncbi:hypothetical protein ACQKNX_12190 [Lysinibacillus sp. NPDC093712]
MNSTLSIDEQLVVCAHELGYATLHTKLNTPFMGQIRFSPLIK